MIEARIAALPDDLAPLKAAAIRYLKYPSVISADGAANIGHRPWVAELNYMLTLYPGASEKSLADYCRAFRLQIPECYAAFLRSMSGAFCFGMSLFGITGSWLNGRSVLDRSVLQCHDLATAVREWSTEYRVPEGQFHFGFRHYTSSENVGYFIGDSRRICSVKKRGKVVAEYSNMTDFLAAELQESEKFEEVLHPAQWKI